MKRPLTDLPRAKWALASRRQPGFQVVLCRIEQVMQQVEWFSQEIWTTAIHRRFLADRGETCYRRNQAALNFRVLSVVKKF
jgi:hypothetical protein